MKAYANYLNIFICVFIVGCVSHPSQNKAVKFPDYLPKGLIIGNFNDADIVVAVAIDKVVLDAEESIRNDRGKIGYAMLIYEGTIFHSYKGNLEKDRIAFRNLQEHEDGLVEKLNKTKISKIVFLKKDNKKGEYIAPEFSIFTFSDELHLALIKYAKTQNNL